MQLRVEQNKQHVPPELALFMRIGQACNGFPPDAVLGACYNLIANVITQQCDTKAKAEQQWDELIGKMKSTLLDARYYPGGMRKTLAQPGR